MKCKKTMAVLLLLVLCLTIGILSVTALADDGVPYTITVDPATRGTITVSDTTAAEGTKIYLTFPDSTYFIDFNTLKIIDVNDNEISILYDDSGMYFVMPASAVTITANLYNIQVNHTSGGTITVDKTIADPGESVTVTVTPANGYALSGLYYEVNNESGSVKTDIDISEDINTYSFVMPSLENASSPVFIGASFTYIPQTANVSYIDENGDMRTVPATLLTGTEPWTYNYGADIHIGASGQETWYAVHGDIDYNGTMYQGFNANLIADGPVNLILCDGASLTGVGDLANSTIKIYGQTDGTGTASANKLRNANLSLYGGSMTFGMTEGSNIAITVSGGSLTVTGEAVQMQNPMLFCDTLTVTGGIVSANGISADNVTLNGGSLTTGSEGLTCRGDLIMTGGNLNVAGNVYVTGDIRFGATENTDSIDIGSVTLNFIELTSVFTDGNERYEIGRYYSDRFTMPLHLVPVTMYNITCTSNEGGTISAPAKAIEGETVALTVTPNAGYAAELTITDADDNIITYTDDYTFIMPGSDVTVDVSFGYGVTVVTANEDLGTVRVLVNGEETKLASVNDVVSIIVTPNTGCRVSQFLLTRFATGAGTGASIDYNTSTVNGVTTYTFTMPYYTGVKADITFDYIEYTVTLPGPVSHGRVEITGEYDYHYRYRDRILLKLTPDDGYTISTKSYSYADGQSLVTGQLQPTEDPTLWYFDMPAGYVTVNVEFAKASNITLIQPAYGASLTTDQTENVTEGQWITLKVTLPEAPPVGQGIGYKVKSVTVTGESGTPVAINSHNDYDTFSYYHFYMPDESVTVNASVLFTAWVDNADQYNGVPNGTVTIVGYNGERVEEGTTITVSVVPDAGYRVKSVWYTNTLDTTFPAVTVTETDADGRYIFAMPAYRAKVWAEFEEKAYAITIAETTNGSVTADAPHADAGDTVTLTVTPDEGYLLQYLFVIDADDNLLVVYEDEDNTYTFIMPASDVTVSADFITQWTWLQQQLEEDGNTIVLDRDIVCVDQDEGPLVVPEDTVVTLDLNGHTVDRNLTEPTENGNVITVIGELTLCDSSTEQTGVITGGNNLKDGGGVLVRGEEAFGDEGSFIMEGGTITGNTARDGGGVSVGCWDTDTWDFFYGHFEMYGGVITGNLVATEEQYFGYGGGVYVSEGQFCLFGGEISENHSVLYGGGVYVVFGMSSAPFVVSGAPVVRDNTCGAVPETDNVAIEHWADSCVIYVEDDGLAPEASIGVNVYTIANYDTNEKILCLEPFTSGLSDNGGSASNFVSDFEGYTVVLNEDGEAMLAEVNEPKFATHSLVLSGKIGVNFFMDLRGLSDEERVGTYMTFEITGAGEVSAEPVYFDAGQMNSDQLYYGFTCYVTSIQMADTITATFHYGDDQTVSETYSIAQYIESFEAVADQYDDTTVALVHALADYGHYVQAFLADQKDWTLGEGGDYAEMDRFYRKSYDYDDIAVNLSEKAISRVFGDENIVKAPYTVVLDSDTAIRVYFTPAAGFNGDVSAWMPGYQDEAYLERGTDGRYTVEIANIPAHLLGETYNIFVYTGENCFNDNIIMHTQVNVSAMSYVYAMLTSQAYANNGLAKNAVSSLYAYWQAAVAYKNAHPEN